MGTKEQFAAFRLISRSNGFLGIIEGLVDKGSLCLIKLLYIRLVLKELGLIGLVA